MTHHHHHFCEPFKIVFLYFYFYNSYFVQNINSTSAYTQIQHTNKKEPTTFKNIVHDKSLDKLIFSVCYDNIISFLLILIFNHFNVNLKLF